MVDPLDPLAPRPLSASSSARRQTNHPPELFHILWKDHPADITSNIRSLRNSAALSDVTLVCSESTITPKAPQAIFRAHKIVLASASAFFARFLTYLSVKNNGSSLVLVMTDVEPSMLDLILKFIYDGAVDVESHLVDGFMKACEKLEIRGLASNGAESQESLEDGSVCQYDGPVGPIGNSADNLALNSAKKNPKKRKIDENQSGSSSSTSKVKVEASDFEVEYEEVAYHDDVATSDVSFRFHEKDDAL